jgi:hypothetical protein
MLIQPGRIFAQTVDEAVLKLREQYGNGRLVIYPAHVQPRRSSGLIWFEYYVVLEDDICLNDLRSHVPIQDVLT